MNTWFDQMEQIFPIRRELKKRWCRRETEKKMKKYARIYNQNTLLPTGQDIMNDRAQRLLI